MIRKIRLSVVSICLFFICLLMAFIAGCNILPSQQAQKLSTPVVILTGNVASWEADSNADKFEISLNGELSYLENSVINKTLENGQSLKIRAIGDGVNYSNSDWSNTVTYNSEENVSETFTVTWVNGDTILEKDENVVAGTTPVYNGKTPEKQPTDHYTYEFSGWSPAISPVEGNITYVAQFSEKVRMYNVTFYSEDGITVLDTVSVEYGSEAMYSKATPIKNDDEGYSYTFSKWVTEAGGDVEADLANIVDHCNVYASFEAEAKEVTVNIISNNSDYGNVSVSSLSVHYGSKIEVNEATITIEGEVVVACENEATAQYTYSFLNWTASETVGVDTLITANFSRTLNTYAVKWMNGETVLKIDNVEYGTVPVYVGEEPVKEGQNGDEYIFSGWLPSITAVTQDVVYQAQFTTKSGKYTVTFYDEDGATILGVCLVSPGETALYPNELPTKAPTADVAYVFDMWVDSVGGDTKADLENITEDTNVYAKYLETERKYEVQFVDYDGTVLSKVSVSYGAVAEAPVVPERNGYRFIGWNKEFDCIIEDTVVIAEYIRQYLVRFVDYDGTIIDEQYIDQGEDAVAPESPNRANYRFIGWDRKFDQVYSDLIVQAEYIRQYKVKFLWHDGTILKEMYVDAGTDALPPSAPMLEGFDFIGWDKQYTNITEDISLTTIYKIKSFTVKFIMPDGTLIGEAQTVEYGFSAIAPEIPDYYIEGVGDFATVYEFTEWDKSFVSITEDLTIKAIYDSAYSKPVVVVEFDKNNSNIVNLYIYSDGSFLLSGIELSIDYTANEGNIFLNSAEFDSSCPLWGGDSQVNSNQYVINNNENVFTFAWSDAGGKQFDWCTRAIVLDLKSNGVIVNKDNFKITKCNAIISDLNGENYESMSPVIIYR